MSIKVHISFFCKTTAWKIIIKNTRKKIIIISRKHKKIIKRIIFTLYFLQKVKFEEIRKNCSYIIIYHYI